MWLIEIVYIRSGSMYDIQAQPRVVYPREADMATVWFWRL